MTISTRIGAMALVFVFPATSFGFGLRGEFRGTTVYYCPAPVIYVPVVQPVAIDPCALPMAPPQVGPPAVSVSPPLYAPPTAAPPSTPSLKTTAEPPMVPAKEPEKKAAPPMAPAPPTLSPRTDATRSFYDAYPAATGVEAAAPTSDARVRFWNLSDRTITLNVDKRDYRLTKGQSVKLTLHREFVWKADSHKPQREQVPEQAAGLEIVIRR